MYGPQAQRCWMLTQMEALAVAAGWEALAVD
jgi:hypothetical protein